MEGGGGGGERRFYKKARLYAVATATKDAWNAGHRVNKHAKVTQDAAAGSLAPRASAGTHHAVVVDQLQLVVGQNVAPVVHQVQRHLRRGHARLAAGPAPAHGEQGSDVQLLLSCGRPWPEEEKGDERHPEEPRRSRSTLEN